MALHSTFTSFLAFNLLLYLSHGENSDIFFHQSGAILRGLDTRGSRAVEQPKTETDRSAEVPRFLLHLFRKRTHLPRGRLSERESDIVRVFLRERKYYLCQRLILLS